MGNVCESRPVCVSRRRRRLQNEWQELNVQELKLIENLKLRKPWSTRKGKGNSYEHENTPALSYPLSCVHVFSLRFREEVENNQRIGEAWRLLERGVFSGFMGSSKLLEKSEEFYTSVQTLFEREQCLEGVASCLFGFASVLILGMRKKLYTLDGDKQTFSWLACPPQDFRREFFGARKTLIHAAKLINDDGNQLLLARVLFLLGNMAFVLSEIKIGIFYHTLRVKILEYEKINLNTTFEDYRDSINSIHSMPFNVTVETMILNILSNRCLKNTKLIDYELVRKIGGIDEERYCSRSFSKHGANSSVFLARLKKHPELEVVIKIIHRIGKKEKISEEHHEFIVQNEVNLFLSENEPLVVADIWNINYGNATTAQSVYYGNTVLKLIHHFVDSIQGIKEEMGNLNPMIQKETVFLVYPKLELDLSHRIKERNHRFEELEFLTIMCQMLRSLRKLHQNKVVHADVKSDNFLVGKHGEVVICDLEFQKRFTKESKFQLKYTPGMEIGGAVDCLPPEILSNQKKGRVLNYSKSDVFGLGLISYSMFSEEDPFLEVSADERSLSNYMPLDESVPKDIRDLIDGMIHPEFKERFTVFKAYGICYKLKIKYEQLEIEKIRKRMEMQ